MTEEKQNSKSCNLQIVLIYFHIMVPITSSISTPAVVLRRNALRQVPNTEVGFSCIVALSYIVPVQVECISYNRFKFVRKVEKL